MFFLCAYPLNDDRFCRRQAGATANLLREYSVQSCLVGFGSLEDFSSRGSLYMLRKDSDIFCPHLRTKSQLVICKGSSCKGKMCGDFPVAPYIAYSRPEDARPKCSNTRLRDGSTRRYGFEGGA